jgi:hypothetical protein
MAASRLDSATSAGNRDDWPPGAIAGAPCSGWGGRDRKASGPMRTEPSHGTVSSSCGFASRGESPAAVAPLAPAARPSGRRARPSPCFCARVQHQGSLVSRKVRGRCPAGLLRSNPRGGTSSRNPSRSSTSRPTGSAARGGASRGRPHPKRPAAGFWRRAERETEADRQVRPPHAAPAALAAKHARKEQLASKHPPTTKAGHLPRGGPGLARASTASRGGLGRGPCPNRGKAPTTTRKAPTNRRIRSP